MTTWRANRSQRFLPDLPFVITQIPAVASGFSNPGQARWRRAGGGRRRSHSEQRLERHGRHRKASIHQNVALVYQSRVLNVVFYLSLITSCCLFSLSLSWVYTEGRLNCVLPPCFRKSDKMLCQLVFSLSIWCSTKFLFFLKLVYIMFSWLESTGMKYISVSLQLCFGILSEHER